MKYLDFEKHIKNELQNSEENVQMDALLNSLNLGKEKTKSKGFAFWMLLPFLLLAISIAAWRYLDTQSMEQTGSLLSMSASNSTEIEDAALEDKIERINSNGSAAFESNEHNERNTSDLKSAIDNSLINANHKSNNSNVASTDLSDISIESEKVVNIVTAYNSIKHEEKEVKVDQIKNSKLNNSYAKLDLAKNEILGGDDIHTSNGYNDDDEISPLNSSDIKIDKVRSLLLIEELENPLEVLNENDLDENLFSRMKINCPSFDMPRWHMALIPEVGLFYPIKTLENTSVEESAVFNERSSSETTLEGIELGLFGMIVRDHLPVYLKAGVSYSRISERMELDYEYTVLDTTIDIISSTISGNGDTITHIYGDVITETTYKGSNRQHHYIHLFDIPISLGYRTYFAGLDIGIEAGVKVNFMTRATGNLLVSQKDYTNLSLNKLFKNRIGMSYFGGLMIGRNFGRFGDIFIAPRFTYFPNNFNNQENTINQKYFNIGLNAGVIYKIN